MAVCVYITHPQVVIDPAVPMPRWHLDAQGRARATAFAARRLIAPDATLVSSGEAKAQDLSEILAKPWGNRIVVCPESAENDRSATGYLPAEAFETMVDRLFGFPDESAKGWEPARTAQTRIVGAVTTALATYGNQGPLVFVGHGCVGTLLKCHVGDRAIARSEDQRIVADPGGGNIFVFDLAAHRLICDWTAMEDWQGL
jgi:broad specificity phosphatase PhoE